MRRGLTVLPRFAYCWNARAPAQFVSVLASDPLQSELFYGQLSELLLLRHAPRQGDRI